MSEEEAAILSEMDGMLASETAPYSDGAFLYGEAAHWMASLAIFKDTGALVEYMDASQDLWDKIFELWEAAPQEKKWASLFLTIEGAHFDARFQYPEERDGADEIQRRDRVLAAKYGNKTIYYPPLEEE